MANPDAGATVAGMLVIAALLTVGLVAVDLLDVRRNRLEGSGARRKT